MRKIFVYGDYLLNAGPSNVTRSWVKHSNGEITYMKHKNRFLKMVELFWKIMRAKLVVVSGTTMMGRLPLVKLFHKRLLYVLHGCIAYENKINALALSQAELQAEKDIMDYADKIICVSSGFARWFGEFAPQYKEKILYLNNGIRISPRPKQDKLPRTIAVSGGNRNIKNNCTVCRAVEKLNSKGAGITVCIFGRHYPQNESLSRYPFAKYMGHLEKEEYYNCLDHISLFVVDSLLEPFGLVVGDAINCRCSLLLSKNVGARDIFTLESCDVVEDCFDVNEVAEKILYLLENPNTDRLLESIDVEACSEEQAYTNFIKLCEGL